VAHAKRVGGGRVWAPVHMVGWQARRAARLAELGYTHVAGYLKARHVEQGWSVKRMRAELGVGRRWLVGS
jgi:hypothetical protein